MSKITEYSNMDAQRSQISNMNPNRDRGLQDAFVKSHKKFYGINVDGFCVDQSKVYEEKCFWCMEYVRGNNLCRKVGDNRLEHPGSWLDKETRTYRCLPEHQIEPNNINHESNDETYDRVCAMNNPELEEIVKDKTNETCLMYSREKFIDMVFDIFRSELEK